jgi:hypothetical protein
MVLMLEQWLGERDPLVVEAVLVLLGVLRLHSSRCISFSGLAAPQAELSRSRAVLKWGWAR